ncbi:hypothetical protein SAMN05216409_13312 [Pseudomonas lutea]|uniref:Uncharacterized protein n=1 Tax=Pseudomonas lutea TaxID=243924 RepID=A0A9X8QM47_9PSED|nr:hypothetical protein [Pseudomonas lutea]SER51175.1 hypothetical protein SAMN05216409_1326 [Pseudomonas lutea]SER52052.1 hypothetical protein SAMN05216409_13312 [Pseudomonas lutea]
MAKLYLVWNENKSECIGFTDKHDAEQAAGLTEIGLECATLTEAWREIYADDEPDEQFEIQEVDV